MKGLLLKGQQKNYFIKKAVWLHLASTELLQNESERCRNPITDEGWCSRQPAAEVQQQHRDQHMVCPPKHPGVPSLQKPLAPSPLAHWWLEYRSAQRHGKQLRSVLQTRVDKRSALNSQQSWPRKDVREPHSGSLSCAGLLPTSTSWCLCGRSSPNKTAWILGSCLWQGEQTQASSWFERVGHSCSFGFEFTH